MRQNDQISSLSKRIQAIKASVAQEQGRLSELRNQREQLLVKLRALDVDPSELDNVIIQKTNTIDKLSFQALQSITVIEEVRNEIVRP